MNYGSTGTQSIRFIEQINSLDIIINLEIEKFTMSELSSKEEHLLWLRMRKDDVFDDLCDARDSVVRVMEVHSLSLDALEAELRKWDTKISTIFAKAISKEIKLKKKNHD